MARLALATQLENSLTVQCTVQYIHNVDQVCALLYRTILYVKDFPRAIRAADLCSLVSLGLFCSYLTRSGTLGAAFSLL